MSPADVESKFPSKYKLLETIFNRIHRDDAGSRSGQGGKAILTIQSTAACEVVSRIVPTLR